MPTSYELRHGLGDEETNYWYKRSGLDGGGGVFNFGIELEDDSGLIQLEDGAGFIELEDGP